MRLLFIVLTLLLVVTVVGFVVTNLDTEVGITVWKTFYPNVRLSWVVLGSLVVGIVYVGLLAVFEGARTRLANRRLTRELQKLETELNYLRTQPPATTRMEPDMPEGGPLTESTAETSRGGLEHPPPPSAPVYGAEEEDDEPEDDVYSGGRAV